MTLEEYVKELESKVDLNFVESIKDWPTETKLYMYLHNIQLSYMQKYMLMVDEVLTDFGRGN